MQFSSLLEGEEDVLSALDSTLYAWIINIVSLVDFNGHFEVN